MTELPIPTTKIVKTETRTLYVELTEEHIHKIVLEWAKTQGFSHRAAVSINGDEGMVWGEIKEQLVIQNQNEF